VRQLPERIFIEKNEVPAEHLCRRRAGLGAEVANFPRDFAIFLANKNEFDFWMHKCLRGSLGKTRVFQVGTCAPLVPRREFDPDDTTITTLEFECSTTSNLPA
jgi:hypothetical protein